MIKVNLEDIDDVIQYYRVQNKYAIKWRGTFIVGKHGQCLWHSITGAFLAAYHVFHGILCWKVGPDVTMEQAQDWVKNQYHHGNIEIVEAEIVDHVIKERPQGD